MVGVQKNLWKVVYTWPKNQAACQVKDCGKVVANNGFAKASHAKMHERKGEVVKISHGWAILTGEDPSLEAQGLIKTKMLENGTVVDRHTGKTLKWEYGGYYVV